MTATRYTLRLDTVSIVCSPPVDGSGMDASQPEYAAAIIAGIIESEPMIEPDSEVFGFVALDLRHRVTGFKILTVGTATQAPVDMNKLFRCALELSARGVVLFHTHPSGDLAFSRDDLELTKRAVNAGSVLDVTVHDHILFDGGRCDRWTAMRSGRADIFIPAAS